MLPELTPFCHYIRHFIIGLSRENDDDVNAMFIARQLVEMTSAFDLADEVGRNNLAKLCKDIMGHKLASFELMEPLVKVFSKIRTDTDMRVQELAELIAEIRDPMKEETKAGEEEMEVEQEEVHKESKKTAEAREIEQRKKKVEIAKVKVQLNIVKSDMDEAVQNQDFAKAQELKVKIEELNEEVARLQEELTDVASVSARNSPAAAPAKRQVEPEETSKNGEDSEAAGVDDPNVTRKCLEIIYHMMQDKAIKSLSPTLMTLLDELILPSIRDLVRLKTCPSVYISPTHHGESSYLPLFEEQEKARYSPIM